MLERVLAFGGVREPNDEPGIAERIPELQRVAADLPTVRAAIERLAPLVREFGG